MRGARRWVFILSTTSLELEAQSLSMDAEDWIFQLRDGRSVHHPAEIVGSPKFKLGVSLPLF